jgi:hypothetical protein
MESFRGRKAETFRLITLLASTEVEYMAKTHKSGKARNTSSGTWATMDMGHKSTVIISSLNNKKYVARTFEGIAKEIGTTKAQVINVIKSNNELRSKIKLYRRRAEDGRILITTKERFSKEASAIDKFIDIFSSEEVSLEDAN